MALELKGVVYRILPEQTGEGRNGTWVKQDFVIETQEQYPKKINISTWGEVSEKVKNLKIGDNVKVGINIESREWEERWFTDIKAWKISKIVESPVTTNQATTPPPATVSVSNPVNNVNQAVEEDTSDDLPF